jgi:iron-sulfur cluster assembly accessory protein
MPEAAQTETEPRPIEITDAAADRLREEMVSTEGDVLGLRLLVQPADCGLRYGLSFARDGAQDRETVVSSNDIDVYVDEDALPFVEGATVDFQQTMLGQGFAIENPNEMDGDCGSGCGCR